MEVLEIILVIMGLRSFGFSLRVIKVTAPLISIPKVRDLKSRVEDKAEDITNAAGAVVGLVSKSKGKRQNPKVQVKSKK